jgi:hypothetical protein
MELKFVVEGKKGAGYVTLAQTQLLSMYYITHSFWFFTFQTKFLQSMNEQLSRCYLPSNAPSGIQSSRKVLWEGIKIKVPLEEDGEKFTEEEVKV